MRAILDTSAFLWFLGGSKKLSNNARKFIGSFENTALPVVAIREDEKDEMVFIAIRGTL